MPSNDPEIYLFAGMSGYGKTHRIFLMLDRNKPIFALDFRGQLAEKFGENLYQDRASVKEELKKTNFFILYQPGFDEYSLEDDIDWFLTLAYCMENVQIVIDEMDFELKSTEYPASFRKLIASARTQNLTVYCSAHRLKECPVKLRALGKKVIFRLQEDSDLEYLSGLEGFDKEQIKRLKKREYVIFPIETKSE
jgi:hypothetical protein